MPIEFLGIGATSDGSETRPRRAGSFDADYTLRLARAHEDNGWDRVLTVPPRRPNLVRPGCKRLQARSHSRNASLACVM